MKLVVSTSSPPIGVLLTWSHIPKENNISFEWGKETALQVSPRLIIDGPNDIIRYFASLSSEITTNNLNALQKTEVDQWLSFSVGVLSSSQKIQDAIRHLDAVLATSTYLVGSNLSIADLTLFGALFSSQNVAKLDSREAHNVKRWYTHINSCAQVKKALQLLPQDAVKSKPDVKSNEMKEEGKFVELPGAEKGKVVVRFPPEASGYLHIGHAKAALLNWYYKELFDGILIMRFDDTNPDKEKVDFEKVILEDLKLLEIYPDKFTHTSEYFPLMLELCEGLLRSGKAYVDDTSPEQMKNEREARQPSRNRDNTADKNFSMWNEMINGTEYGQKCCVRAKIDMTSDNGCMRDPTIYRCKNEPHPRTKSLYKVYPTYDFACPIVDSVEGVTHALRTMEYHDRDDQYYWFIDALKLTKPYIWEYSRLNMMNTVLSKRKLTWFVEQGLVDSWEDPRFPTVRGVLRRGMTVKGLKQFIIAQGSSRSVVQMEWDKIWAFNKKVIDPVAPRYTALEAGKTVIVNVEGAKEDTLTVAKHPKNSEIGTKVVSVSPHIMIATDDAQVLKEQENATFINWGNLLITKLHRSQPERLGQAKKVKVFGFASVCVLSFNITCRQRQLIPRVYKCIDTLLLTERDSSGLVRKVDAKLNLTNTDFKKTSKLTWLADVTGLTRIEVLYYDHIISKPVLSKDEDFKQYINKDSKKSVEYVGDAELKTLKAGDIIQLQRIGYFRVDIPASSGSHLVLIHIPDGSSKSPIASSGTRAITDNEPLTDKEIESIAVQWRFDHQNRLADNSKGSKQADNVKQLKVNNTSKPKDVVPSSESADLAASIEAEGNKIRQLKSSKASKSDIDAAVKILLALKQEYKAKTGTEWKPGASPVLPTPTVTEQPAATLGSHLSDQIQSQGDKVRQLKSSKANKDEIDAAVKVLLALKQEFKTKTGQEWKPGASPVLPTPTVPAQPAATLGSHLSDQIQSQGDKVRQLKSSKANKDEIDAAVKVLLALKQEFKTKTGQEWKPGVPTSTPPVPAQSFFDLSEKIQLEGDKVRQLKLAKAPKPDIDAAVKILLELKQEYKNVAGEEWKPKPATSASVAVPTNGSSNSLSDKITEQGNIVRQLKSTKASKPDIDAAVKVLLSLKSDYQAATGQEWKPGSSAAPLPPKAVVQNNNLSTQINEHKPSQTAGQLSDLVIQQGNLVRQLKSQKANKSEIDEAVKTLLTLKLNYKNLTGSDWQPTPVMSTVDENPLASPSVLPTNNNDVSNRIIAQGDRVRDLKASKADKTTIDNEVKVLLALKTEFKNINGQEWKPPGGAAARKPSEKKQNDKKPKQEKKDKEKSVEGDETGSMKKQTRLCLEARKEENLPDWYSQVITKGELIEYYDVSGCYILRPWAFAVWEAIQSFLDKEIKKLGVVNAYFPMFVSKSVLEREKAHIADFAPEVAWVTKSGESDLAEPIAIRPTSETAMYPAYAKWIKSHRDLPLRLNQWNNVVRWEFKHPQPFLRTREFLWQEGHTAFATYKEAEDEVYQILELYKQVYTDLLAIPVVKGRKTEKEKFAGGDFTTTVEAFISASGRGIQGATSHHLGHNFSKMFDITVEDPETNEKMYVFQNSWGITTRTIGVMIMVHADNQGLVLPPAVAALQVIIVPCGITASLSEAVRTNIINSCKKVDDELRYSGLRSKLDERHHYSPGWKFNDWELKGVPLRVEIGPKDLEKNQLTAVRRDNGNKSAIPLIRAAGEIRTLLDNIQVSLYAAAEKDLKDHTKLVTKWEDFCSQLDSKNIILSPFCEDIHCEENIKKDSARDRDLDPGAPAMGAKSLCIPFEQPAEIKAGDKCIHPSCSKPAKSYTLFGRSY